MESDVVKINKVVREDFFHMVYWDEQNGTKEMMPWIRNEQRIIRMFGWWEDYKEYVKKHEIKEKAKQQLRDRYDISQEMLESAEKMDILDELFDKLGLEQK